MGKEDKKNGYLHARIGRKFSDKIELIKDARLRKGSDHDRLSTEKISNLIVKHKSWAVISEDIINATKEEIEKHGSEE